MDKGKGTGGRAFTNAFALTLQAEPWKAKKSGT